MLNGFLPATTKPGSLAPVTAHTAHSSSFLSGTTTATADVSAITFTREYYSVILFNNNILFSVSVERKKKERKKRNQKT